MSEKNELFLYFIPNRRRKSPFRRSPSDFDNFWIRYPIYASDFFLCSVLGG